MDLGFVTLCVGDVGLHLRDLRPYPLRALGRADDLVHLSVREAHPISGARGTLVGGDPSCPPRTIEPVDPRWLQHSRQRPQLNVEFHRWWRVDCNAVAA